MFNGHGHDSVHVRSSQPLDRPPNPGDTNVRQRYVVPDRPAGATRPDDALETTFWDRGNRHFPPRRGDGAVEPEPLSVNCAKMQPKMRILDVRTSARFAELACGDHGMPDQTKFFGRKRQFSHEGM